MRPAQPHEQERLRAMLASDAASGSAAETAPIAGS